MSSRCKVAQCPALSRYLIRSRSTSSSSYGSGFAQPPKNFTHDHPYYLTELTEAPYIPISQTNKICIQMIVRKARYV